MHLYKHTLRDFFAEFSERALFYIVIVDVFYFDPTDWLVSVLPLHGAFN